MKISKGAQEILKTKLLVENYNKNVNEYYGDDGLPYDYEPDPIYEGEFTLRIANDDLIATLTDNVGGTYELRMLEELEELEEIGKGKDDYKRFIQTAFNLGGINPAALKDQHNLDIIDDIIMWLYDVNGEKWDWEYPDPEAGIPDEDLHPQGKYRDNIK